MALVDSETALLLCLIFPVSLCPDSSFESLSLSYELTLGLPVTGVGTHTACSSGMDLGNDFLSSCPSRRLPAGRM